MRLEQTPAASTDVVDRAYAHLTIKSRHLTPEQMVDLVGVEPKRRWRIGDETSYGPKRAVHEKHGIQYRSRLDENAGGERHLDDLIDFIRVHKTALARITEHEAVESALLGLWSFSTYGTQSFSLSPADLELLAELDVGLWIVCDWDSVAPDDWRSDTRSRDI